MYLCLDGVLISFLEALQVCVSWSSILHKNLTFLVLFWLGSVNVTWFYKLMEIMFLFPTPSASPHRRRGHRSRSRSPAHRRHSRSRSRSRSPHRRRHRSKSKSRSKSPEKSSKKSKKSEKSDKSDKRKEKESESGGLSKEELEIKEANELRAKLGLKPLKP